MGFDKARMDFCGVPLVRYIIDRLDGLANEVIITTNHPEHFVSFGARLAQDVIPNKGALGGLYTAFFAATNPVSAVIGCDMPFANKELFSAMIEILDKEDLDAVLPSTTDGLEPLHAVYRTRTCLPAVWQAIMADQHKLIAFLPKVKSLVLSPEETAKFDSGYRMFHNINTPEDMKRAEEMVNADPSLRNRGIGHTLQ